MRAATVTLCLLLACLLFPAAEARLTEPPDRVADSAYPWLAQIEVERFSDSVPLIDDMVETLEGEREGFAPVMIDPAWLDEAGKASQRRALQAYYDYRSDGFDHRRRVFAWQLFSSKAIFLLVIFLVTAGIYFSWLQFRQGLKGGEGSDSHTTLEATAGGIKLSSPVLGIIILTLSLLFFYLYLVHVYPIEEIL